MFRIYRLWTSSAHKTQYTLGYYDEEGLAEEYRDRLINTGFISNTGSSPGHGIEPIVVITRADTVGMKEDT